MNEKPFALSLKVVILDDRNRCLLIKRSMSSKGNPGKWDLPGGKLDAGEVFDEGLLREVREETGVTIRLRHALAATDSESPTKKVVYLIMEADYVSGEVRLSEEHEDYTWVNAADLGGVDMAEQLKPFATDYASRSL